MYHLLYKLLCGEFSLQQAPAVYMSIWDTTTISPDKN